MEIKNYFMPSRTFYLLHYILQNILQGKVLIYLCQQNYCRESRSHPASLSFHYKVKTPHSFCCIQSDQGGNWWYHQEWSPWTLCAHKHLLTTPNSCGCAQSPAPHLLPGNSSYFPPGTGAAHPCKPLVVLGVRFFPFLL